VGAIRSGHDLLEAVVFPSASFVPGYEIYFVDIGKRPPVRRGSLAIARYRHSGDRTSWRSAHSAQPDQINDKVQCIAMPDGFDEALTRTELTDLLSFLQNEKTDPQTSPPH